MSKIPDFSQEIETRYKKNTDTLISMGVKEWMKGRKKRKYKMSELEQDETLRKLEREVEVGDGKGT